MDIFISIWFLGISIVQQVLQLSFAGRFTATQPKWRHYILYVVLAQLANQVGIFLQSSFFVAFLDVVFLYSIACYLLENKLMVSAIISVLTVAMMQLSCGLMDTLCSLVLPYIQPPNPLLWILPVIASAIALFLFYYFSVFIARKFTLDKDVSHQYLIMLLAPILFLWAIEFYIVNKAYGNVVTIPYPIDPEKHIELFIIQLLGFATTISSLYAYQKLCDSFQAKSRLALLEQETHAQKTYITEAKMRYEQTISFRHDIKNHFVVLDGLLKSGQIEDAQKYLKKLQTVTDGLSFSAYTGNAVIDILLCSKIELAKQNHILTDLSLTLPETCKMSDLDLCVIFSNALDNAIIACAQISGEKTISITGEQQGAFYLLEFVNSCKEATSPAVTPGTGLNNIKIVAEKYGGAITIERQADKFCLDVLLNIS